MIDINYTNLLNLIQPYKISGRTDSTAFLHWFLVNIYRLERIEVDNIVCDGHGDKGIDGIYINDNEGLIDVFQSKIVQNESKTLGDTQLKEFLGSLQQLITEDSINGLIDSLGEPNTKNIIQLKNLLLESKEYLQSPDYKVRGIFVTNTNKDDNANNLLKTISGDDNILLEVWDKNLISEMYVDSDKAIRATSELAFDVFGWDYSKYNVDNFARVVIAAVKATDIVKMEGLDNQKIFDLNLRKSLGKTKVNKDIYHSIEEENEHKKFLLYHNGITIICGELNTEIQGKIIIKDYAVVNGCQSVSCLYSKRDIITDDLRILTRIIEIKSDSELITKITHNSNNQNGIKIRDFRSNTKTQVRLQREINEKYPDYFYQIKNGEKSPPDKMLIDNQLAGRILLVFDLEEPWAVQGIKKIFEDSHSKIFSRPEVTGGRIVSLFKLYQQIQQDLPKIEPQLFQGYQITRFLLLHLVSQVFKEDEIGKNFRAKPEDFLFHPSKEKKFFECLHTILGDLIIDLNGEFEDKGGENYDFKTIYKSPKQLKELTNEVLKSYKKVIQRGRVESFTELWRKNNE
ncbi:AIPR family protein [Cyanobacterium aponinum AL20118]|uniref:AIPR family protein n=1 Tax=Cyanobacterium aponinum AL20115 TaxID=3090662 RepID=A0AAF1C3A9_9CHRO|nr:AIPR family protein [Cyanobacterium aponinum]WPF89573.1 AIPR family protein [Cyanobacterium aponinum AL20115]